MGRRKLGRDVAQGQRKVRGQGSCGHEEHSVGALAQGLGPYLRRVAVVAGDGTGDGEPSAGGAGPALVDGDDITIGYYGPHLVHDLTCVCACVRACVRACVLEAHGREWIHVCKRADVCL